MMTIQQLNDRYGAPGRIVFHEGHAGHPNVVIANKYGTAEIALMGGYVLSYRPTGHAEVLFRPAKRDYNRADDLHGGVPVCWPQFGNRAIPGMKGHGFARFMPFAVRGTVYSEEETEITLGLKSDEATRSLWPHDFDLELKISVTMKLNLRLTTKNTGAEPFAFTAGFHPYFSVRDRVATVLKGVDGCSFIDARDMSDRVCSGDFPLTEATDHVFTLKPAPKHEAAILDPGLKRALALVATGSGKLVVWNPGPEGGVADHGPEDWRRFLCVEPVTDWPAAVSLAPGESAALSAAIQSVLDGVAG